MIGLFYDYDRPLMGWNVLQDISSIHYITTPYK